MESLKVEEARAAEENNLKSELKRQRACLAQSEAGRHDAIQMKIRLQEELLVLEEEYEQLEEKRALDKEKEKERLAKICRAAGSTLTTLTLISVCIIT